MEFEEVEAVLEKVWDLHDKLSDAIHSCSRSHFLLVTSKSVSKKNSQLYNDSAATPPLKHGYVFTKEPLDAGYDAVLESKSLNAIRSALENLEDQLEFFHTVQTQQRAEKDAAIARLEQSRIILAMRLAEHQGKKYKVIEETQAFVGDVQDASRFVFPANYLFGDSLVKQKEKGHNPVLKCLFGGMELVKSAFSVGHLGGLLSNAAVFTVSLLALLHLHQISEKGHSFELEDAVYKQKVVRLKGSPPHRTMNQLDVTLAKG